MTLQEIMQPFAVLINWMRSYTFHIGEYPLTFWDLFVWHLLAGIVIGVIVKIKNG